MSATNKIVQEHQIHSLALILFDLTYERTTSSTLPYLFAERRSLREGRRAQIKREKRAATTNPALPAVLHLPPPRWGSRVPFERAYQTKRRRFQKGSFLTVITLAGGADCLGPGPRENRIRSSVLSSGP